MNDYILATMYGLGCGLATWAIAYAAVVIRNALRSPSKVWRRESEKAWKKLAKWHRGRPIPVEAIQPRPASWVLAELERSKEAARIDRLAVQSSPAAGPWRGGKLDMQTGVFRPASDGPRTARTISREAAMRRLSALARMRDPDDKPDVWPPTRRLS